MSISMTVGGTTVDLHPDLRWSDEFNWHPIAQTAQRTVTGALIVSTKALTAGRPITLEPPDDDSAWLPYSSVSQLKTWAALPGQVVSLTLRGETRNVVFRHQDGAGLEAVPVLFLADGDRLATDFFRVTLRLMEI